MSFPRKRESISLFCTRFTKLGIYQIVVVISEIGSNLVLPIYLLFPPKKGEEKYILINLYKNIFNKEGFFDFNSELWLYNSKDIGVG